LKKSFLLLIFAILGATAFANTPLQTAILGDWEVQIKEDTRLMMSFEKDNNYSETMAFGMDGPDSTYVIIISYIEGTWTLKDSQLTVTYDPKKIAVKVTDVQNASESETSVDSIKVESIKKDFEETLKPVVEEQYAKESTRMYSHVAITGDTLTLTAKNGEFKLTRSTDDE
jgi:hypothetical protein